MPPSGNPGLGEGTIIVLCMYKAGVEKLIVSETRIAQEQYQQGRVTVASREVATAHHIGMEVNGDARLRTNKMR